MEISINQVYAPEKNKRGLFRRIVSIYNGYVFYSVGNDETRNCKIETFKKWISSYKAKTINEAH